MPTLSPIPVPTVGVTVNLRQLIVRSNRFLGTALVERGLIRQEDLEKASDFLLQNLQNGNFFEPRLLHILFYDLKVVKETELIASLSKGAPVGLVDLRRLEVKLPPETTAGECRATATVPFDKIEDIFLVATTYYLSPPIREYWERKLQGKLEWYATTLESLEECLKGLESAGKSKAAEAAAARNG